jgi:ribosomal protein L14
VLRTSIFVSDNSGVLRGLCIRNYYRSCERTIRPADLCLLAVKKYRLVTKKIHLARKKTKLNKNKMEVGLVTTTRGITRRRNGSFIRFARLTAVIVRDNRLKATRITGIAAREARLKYYLKLVSLTPKYL